MFNSISSITIVLIESVYSMLFYKIFCEEPKLRREARRIVSYFSLVILCNVFAYMLQNHTFIRQLVMICIVTVVMKLYYKIKIIKSFVIALFFQATLILVDYVVYIADRKMFMMSGNITDGHEIAGLLAVIFARGIAFLLIVILNCVIGRKKEHKLPDSEWIKLMIFPVFTVLMIPLTIKAFPYTDNNRQAYVLYGISIGLVTMNIFVYYLINEIYDKEKKLYDKNILEIQMKNEMDTYHMVSKNYEEQRQRAHEFKNHLLCIDALIKEGNTEKATEYISRISESSSSDKQVIDTNNAAVNAVLNSKNEEALSKGIVFTLMINDLSGITIRDEDIVVILSNLLNNAIEASMKCGDMKVIKVKCVRDKGKIILSVTNNYNGELYLIGDKIATSKKEKPSEHGFGIRNVKTIVKSYDGEYVMRARNGEFMFVIMIRDNANRVQL